MSLAACGDPNLPVDDSGAAGVEEVGPPAESTIRQHDEVRERHRQQVHFLALATHFSRRRFLAVHCGAEPNSPK